MYNIVRPIQLFNDSNSTEMVHDSDCVNIHPGKKIGIPHLFHKKVPVQLYLACFVLTTLIDSLVTLLRVFKIVRLY